MLCSYESQMIYPKITAKHDPKLRYPPCRTTSMVPFGKTTRKKKPANKTRRRWHGMPKTRDTGAGGSAGACGCRCVKILAIQTKQLALIVAVVGVIDDGDGNSKLVAHLLPAHPLGSISNASFVFHPHQALDLKNDFPICRTTVKVAPKRCEFRICIGMRSLAPYYIHCMHTPPPSAETRTHMMMS